MASKDVLVCGTLNLETTFPIAGFPLNYEAICYRPFEIRSQPSGVGFNIARALSTLGNRVRLVSMVGSDFLGTVLRQSMAKFGVSDEFILPILDQTPQSIVIFDGAGRRMEKSTPDASLETQASAPSPTSPLRRCSSADRCN